MMTLPKHFMVAECDGALYDTRKVDWSATALRPNYSRQHREMHALADVKATLRAGAYAWPGGYPLYFITQDGAALCFACAHKEFRQIAWDWMNKASTGWRIAGCDVNYESTDLYCDHCSKAIESAYSETEKEATCKG